MLESKMTAYPYIDIHTKFCQVSNSRSEDMPKRVIHTYLQTYILTTLVLESAFDVDVVLEPYDPDQHEEGQEHHLANRDPLNQVSVRTLACIIFF